MADILTVVEVCRISPPPETIGERTLALTFCDMFWLPWPPSHQLFMYHFPHSKTHFLGTILPTLKHSLSITLSHFFPFASNLLVFPKQDHSTTTRKPEIRHVEGDSVAFTVAECSLDFNDLVGNHPRACNKFHALVPRLGRASKSTSHNVTTITIPLISIQVTLFPNSGISIGITNHHTLCDASTKFDFLNAWTSIAKHGTNELFLANGSLPFYDRVLKYPDTLHEMCMNPPLDVDYQPPHVDIITNKVRGTFVLTRPHINRVKIWLLDQMPTLEYISSFSLACAFVWSVMAKSRAQIGDMNNGDDGDDDDELERLICSVEWRARLDPPLPQTYFGNCIGPCTSSTIKSAILASDEGFLTAVQLLGKALSETLKKKNGLIKDAWMWKERSSDTWPRLTVGVAGSPKFKIYEMDFGWQSTRRYRLITVMQILRLMRVEIHRKILKLVWLFLINKWMPLLLSLDKSGTTYFLINDLFYLITYFSLLYSLHGMIAQCY